MTTRPPPWLPLASAFLAAVLASSDARLDTPEWPQWGGPTRDFRSPSTGLAATWPATGPKALWSRPLGEGHSSIVAAEGLIFTQYRPTKSLLGVVVSKFTGSDPEVVVALDPATGATRWEHRYEAPIVKGMDTEYGLGPHSTPLVVDGRVFAVGMTGRLHALDAKTGTVLWSHDLWNEMGGKVMGRGYSCSPLAYGETIVLTLGGPGQSVVAFRQKDGQVAWKNGRFSPSPASPILVNVDGQDQLVVFNADGIAGLDPNGGATLWTHPHKTDYGLNISTPVWSEGNLLFCSSAYSGGSRLLQLSQSGGKTTVRELWFTSRMRLHFGTAVRIGDFVYGSSGDFGPSFFSAVSVKTGQVAWQDRGLARASFVYADGRLILLDEDGTLALATVSPEGLKIQARAQVLASKAWTAPTLVGRRLYIRDRATIKALDLGA
jgi:outer membrane protein assembly factor BamB